MSSRDWNKPHSLRLAASLALVAALAAGCTVQPLYGTSPAVTQAGAPLGAELASVAIAPVNDRVSQEVRNHLIFLLYGGAGEPVATRYTVQLAVAASDAAAAAIQVGRDEEPTASVVTVRASYTLTDAATGRQVARGMRSTSASYDVSRQQFAALRATRDAQNRAAREAAELVRLALAQDLSRLSTP